MADNNIYGNMLSRPTQAYTRQPGVASGLGQKQPQTCPTGYRYDTVQGKCVAINQPTPGFWQQNAQAVNTVQQPKPMGTQAQAKPKPMFTSQPLPKKMDEFSPYAQLLAAAVDLNSPAGAITTPYPQMQQPNVQGQLNINQDFLRLVNGR